MHCSIAFRFLTDSDVRSFMTAPNATAAAVRAVRATATAPTGFARSAAENFVNAVVTCWTTSNPTSAAASTARAAASAVTAATTSGCSLTNSVAHSIASAPLCWSSINAGASTSPIAIFRFSVAFWKRCWANSPVSDIFSKAVAAAPVLPSMDCTRLLYLDVPLFRMDSMPTPASELDHMLLNAVVSPSTLSARTCSTSPRELPSAINSAKVLPVCFLSVEPTTELLLPSSFSAALT